MRILVNDYAGHAFPLQLSRALAAMGHEVSYAFFADVAAPRGDVSRREGDPENFSVIPISLGEPVRKYDFLHRILRERAYAHQIVAIAKRQKVDVVLVSNTPDDVLDVLCKGLPRSMRIVYWLQDVYSLGIRMVLNRKLPFAGDVAGAIYRRKERRFARRANHIVAITEDFRPYLTSLGVPPDKISVIENWAPLDEIVTMPRDNAWKREQGLSGKTVVLYSGTLGLKHNPALLADVAQAFLPRHEVMIVVISEGLGADYLVRQKQERGLSNLLILPWQPYARLSESLSSGDVLTVVIEQDAAGFSVPSKILSALCAGRPLVASVPAGNLAARTILAAGAGLVSEPGSVDTFINNLKTLLDRPEEQDRMGRSARRYAEKAFAIGPIAARFDGLLRGSGSDLSECHSSTERFAR